MLHLLESISIDTKFCFDRLILIGYRGWKNIVRTVIGYSTISVCQKNRHRYHTFMEIVTQLQREKFPHGARSFA
jgi:hypothetical protein